MVRNSVCKLILGFQGDLPLECRLTVVEREQAVEFYLEELSKDSARQATQPAATHTIGLNELRPRQLAVPVFADIQDRVIEQVLGAAWPRCPIHGTHPLEPSAEGWVCPVERQRWSYGSTRSWHLSPEPERQDGVVRWFSERRGSGVIAHEEGDIFFHINQLVGSKNLGNIEGIRANVELSDGRIGRFRLARRVVLVT